MASSTGSDTDDGLATAVGQYVLGEKSLGKAAEDAGLSRWEFESVLEDAGFSALYGPRNEEQVEAEVDAARDLDE